MQWLAYIAARARRLLNVYSLGIVAAFLLGFLAASLWPQSGNPSQLAIREYDRRYEYIRPLLICQISEQEEAGEFNSLEFKIHQIIDSAKKTGKIQNASVYFRDLTSGRWMGVNETETYAPASLLKVPIMMAYFKESKDDSAVLSRTHYYVENDEADDLITRPLLESRRNHSVGDLIRAMIIQSDNTAMQILQSNADQSLLEETYGALGISDPSGSTEIYKLSAKQYALFFRVLYNGTFLDREMSNRALELLAESEFDLGLRAGTPENIKVANKYGVRGFTEPDGSHGVELSDCGIVYDPSSPFLLCVMAHGGNAYVLADFIKNIAETVYRSVKTEDAR